MSDPRFFRPAGPFSANEIARHVGAEHAGGEALIEGVAPLDAAGPTDLAFFEDRRLVDTLRATGAGACLVAPAFRDAVPHDTVALLTPRPALAFAQALALFFPGAMAPQPLTVEHGHSRFAAIDPSTRIEADVVVEPGAVIGPDVEIGSGSLIGPCAVIGAGVRLGRGVRVSAHCVVQHALVGNRVILHPGVKIGQDGYGYVPGPRGHTKIAQVGRVVIQDDVEIGANTTVDRGALRDTIIGEGTKIDNQCQIAHNVIIGRHCIITAKVGISGSCRLGDFVMIGGNAGLADHVTIGTGAQIGAKAGVMHDVPAGERWMGYPAKPGRDFFREVVALTRLAKRRGPAGGADREEGE